MAALYSALFGFFAYANFATMKVWTLRVTLLDIGGGVLLTAAAASTGALAILKLR